MNTKTRSTPTRIFTATTLGLFLVAVLLLLGQPASGRDQLTLRVNDLEGPPGGRVAVVVRTYSSRALGQGQICFRAARLAKSSAALGPFARLEGYRVFGKGSVASSASLRDEAGGQTILLHFSSESGRVNRNDGPLAVLYFRLREDVGHRQSFQVRVDPADTMLFGADGEAIAVESKPGTLEVRRRFEEPRVTPDGDTVRPGDRVRLGVESFEPFAIASGQVGLRYDPDVVVGSPKVKMDRRHGKRRMSADTSTPGLVVVQFEAKRGVLNEVPGKFIEIRLRTSRDVEPGTVTKLTFDPSLTFFVTPEGDIRPVELGEKTLTFVARSGRGNDSDSDSDTDDDSDSDSDSDSDTDDDSDSEDDSDGDTDDDSDSEDDSDGDTDGDSDSDTDDDSDSEDDSDGDTDGDSDSEDDSDDSDDDSDDSDEDSGGSG